jgi:hypothetical protein
MNRIYDMLPVLARYLTVEVSHPTSGGPHTIVSLTRQGGGRTVYISTTLIDGEEHIDVTISGVSGRLNVPETAEGFFALLNNN